MFDTLKRLWDAQLLDEAALRRAVEVKKWITVEQFALIFGEPYNSEG